MLDILGEKYYIDLDALDKFISYSVNIPTGATEQHISIAKYEGIKLMIESIFNEENEIDENMGIHHAKNLTIPFRLAFNTLLRHEILKHL